LDDLEVVSTNIICQDNPGAIQVINNGDLNLMYSLDGNNFNDTGLFSDLIVGEYLILVQDENGCQAFLNAEVMAAGPTVIEDIIVTHTSCGLDNGSFEVIASQDENVIYFIDAFDLSDSNIFTDLSPGTYPITIIGPTGCSASSQVVINPSEALIYDGLLGEDDACQKTVGSIEINVTGGTGNISYSFDDGASFQEGEFIDSLSQGFYHLIIQDESFCSHMDSIEIGETPGLVAGPISITETICEIPSGIIQFSAEGGTGSLKYQINGGPLQELPYFDNLSEGLYEVAAVDEIGCFIDLEAEIEVPICPIFIPNIFNPLDLNGNGEFRIFTNDGAEVNIITYQIYDRWGNRIYDASNFNISSETGWWNGNADNIKWSSGVYVYHIEVEYYNGSRELFTGDITLMR